MKNSLLTIVAVLEILGSPVFGRDIGVLVLPIHKGKWTSAFLYENLELRDDFDARGRADFVSHVVGTQFSYGITDQVALAVKSGVFVDPQEDAQGSQWQSRAGYLYGVDLYNEVFPATGFRPGIQVSGGVAGFQLPFDRLISGNNTTLIDQKMSGLEYHGAVLATLRLARVTSYAGLRGFGSSVMWRDNRPGPADPDSVTGRAHGNISVVVGLPIQMTQEVRMQVEGRFIHEMAATVGFTIASF